MFQIQIGGCNNTQVIKQPAASIGKLLNAAEARLKERPFASDEVRGEYLKKLPEYSTWIFQNLQHTFDATRYMIYPFKTLPEEEILSDSYFLDSILDTLTIMAFSEFQCEIIHQHLNISLNGKRIYGVYYKQGLAELVSAFQRLIKCFKEKNINLPVGFIFIILNCAATEMLDPEKVRNLVPDILGDDTYIRPLQTGSPKCISLSSFVIQNCQSVQEAREYVTELLSNV